MKKPLLALLFIILFFTSQAQIMATQPKSIAPEKMIIDNDLWIDATQTYLPVTGEWTNRVEVADVNGDNLLDLLFANGGNYRERGVSEYSRGMNR